MITAEYSKLGFTATIWARAAAEINLIFDWLDANVEDHAYSYNGRDFHTKKLSFEFDNEVDCTMFLLRWA